MGDRVTFLKGVRKRLLARPVRVSRAAGNTLWSPRMRPVAHPDGGLPEYFKRSKMSSAEDTLPFSCLR